jgi:hypothetical protein
LWRLCIIRICPVCSAGVETKYSSSLHFVVLMLRNCYLIVYTWRYADSVYTQSLSPVEQITQSVLILCRSQWPRGLRRRSTPLASWDRGFESHRWHGCLLWVLWVVS